MSKQRYIITAALPYANGPLHIGHLAGCHLPADIFARYLKLQGHDVLFVCGSDEHGAPITLRAKKEGITPQALVDKYHFQMLDTFTKMGINFDIYHRTSDKLHHDTAKEFFLDLYNKGEFIQQTTSQFFDETYQQFLADRYITGTCPICSNPNAYGDQCEKCGKSLSPTDLINPISTLSGKTPILKPTTHWYLPLDKYQHQWLETWIDTQKDVWKPNVYGQCKSWLNQGLEPRAVTRDLDWGVEVPIKEAEGKVMYVWFDAPIGYISATKAWAQANNKDWKTYWQDKQTKLIHFIGKDNIVFHCIIFPAMLKAHGEYILPNNVPANEFLNLEGDKISTSRNWAVWVHEYLERFENKQDVLRYVLCSTAPETKDNDFTWKDFQARNNNELVAIFGNFVNRVLVLTEKYFDNIVPPNTTTKSDDRLVLEQIDKLPKVIADNIEKYRLREALNAFMELARIGNKYLADNEPWKLINNNKDRVATILNIALQICANLAITGQPFMPFTSKKLFAMLNLPEITDWSKAGRSDLLQEGHKLGKSELLFEKIENQVIEQEIQKLLASKASNNQELAKETNLEKPEITYEDFTKLAIKVGTVVEAKKVEKADKLLQLSVQIANETRTIVSGIAEFYSPESIVGQQVCVLANLAPRKIKGIVSKGMILTAQDNNGRLVLVAPKDMVESGSDIG